MTGLGDIDGDVDMATYTFSTSTAVGDARWYANPLVTSVDQPDDHSQPNEFVLFQGYPNPFNPSTTIEFAIPHSSFLVLKVFNLLGEEVATLVEGYRDAGTYSVQWEAAGRPSGLYFYRLEAGEFVETRKLILLR